MQPKEFLRQLQEGDYSSHAEYSGSARAILQDIQNVLVPYLGDSLLRRVQNEFPDLAKAIGTTQLTEVADRVISEQSGMASDVQTPQQIFDHFLVALASAAAPNQIEIREIEEVVAIGIRPTSEVNARARMIPTGLGFVIEVNDGLWWFISAFSKVLALSTHPQEVQVPLLPNERRQSLLAGLIKLSIQAPGLLREVASMHLRDYYQEAFAQRLAIHIKQFAVAHELAHVMMGHLWKGMERARQGSLPSDALLLTDWEEEHEADSVGAGIIFRAADQSADRDNEGPWGYLGADSFFGTMNIIERKCKLPATSHPPSLLRRQRLRSHVQQNFPGAYEAVMRRAVPFGELLDNLASEMARV